MKNKLSLKIGWLYPDLMSTYGDRGNIICLLKRCQWKNILVQIIKIQKNTPISILNTLNLIFGGGAQDEQQEIVIEDLKKEKGKIFKDLIEKGIPALFVCGSPQLFGKSYQTSDNKLIEGLNIFKMSTKNPGKHINRCIGNVLAEVNISKLDKRFIDNNLKSIKIVGFENHGGRTYLDKESTPFAKIIKGYGNNGLDKTEGIIYKNAIGTYLHGPFLSKNPEITDYLINLALYNKYKKIIKTKKLDNSLEIKAKEELF